MRKKKDLVDKLEYFSSKILFPIFAMYWVFLILKTIINK